MQAIGVLIFLFILAGVSFFISASETAIISLSRIRLRHMLSRKVKGSLSVQRLISRLDKFITAILVFNNVVNIAISAIATAICVVVFGYKWGVVLATILTALFIVILCEITPKILAIKNPEKVSLFIAPIMEVFIRVFNPVIFIFHQASNLIIRLLRIKPSKKSPLITEEELRLMIELGIEEGFLSDKEARMLHRIFEFGDTKITDVMVPKDQIIAVQNDISSEDLLNIFAEEGHSRLPVYQGSIDKIIGIVYARDLLYVLKDKSLFLLPDLLHEAHFVSTKMHVNEVLKDFQERKIQIAIVVDEHKKALGMVTLEDLIEEIIGEMEEKGCNKLLCRE